MRCVDHYPLLLKYYLQYPILSTFTQWVSIPMWLFCFGLCMPFLANPKDFGSQAHLTGKEGAWSLSPHLGKGVLWQTGNMDHTANGRTWWKCNLAALVTDLNSTSLLMLLTECSSGSLQKNTFVNKISQVLGGRIRGAFGSLLDMCLWLICVRLFATPQTVARQASLSMGLSRQEYWSGLPFPSPETCLMDETKYIPGTESSSFLQKAFY